MAREAGWQHGQYWALEVDSEAKQKLLEVLSVEERLRALTGEKVEMNEVIDAALIGGIAVRIGDRLYDASVRSRLERLRARLTTV